MNKILVVGGAGYIGSHTVLELIRSGYEPIVLDAFLSSTDKNLKKISELTNKQILVIKGNILDSNLLDNVFIENKIDAVIHFAAYKNAGESVKDPYKYYSNNVTGMLTLLDAMKKNGVNKIVFSSSAAVYGNSDELPINENTRFNPMSSYGESKMIGEMMLKDAFTAYGTNSVSLRYFNVAGADDSGAIGEEVSATGNVIPLIMENLCQRRTGFTLFGSKFNTADGSQERDYIHVTDLASGHIKALELLTQTSTCAAYNLGTGMPTSNFKLIELAEKASGKKLVYTVGEARAGDPETVYADPSKAEKELGWKAKKNIEEIITDAWKWHSSQS